MDSCCDLTVARMRWTRGKFFGVVKVLETRRGEGCMLRGDGLEGFLMAGGWLADED